MNKPPGYDQVNERTKHKYNVYDACTDQLIDSAVAKSEAQACSLVRFRYRGYEKPNGGYKEDNPMYAIIVE